MQTERHTATGTAKCGAFSDRSSESVASVSLKCTSSTKEKQAAPPALSSHLPSAHSSQLLCCAQSVLTYAKVACRCMP